MYQYNNNGRRWYYKDGKWYISVTEFVKNSLPMPIHLQKWYKDNSAEFIDNTLRETSQYGTRLHALIEELLRTGYVEVTPDMDERIVLHLAAIAKFMSDWDVRPMVIEERIRWDATNDFPLSFAGTVDLIAETSNGACIIDFKSGNIQDSHKYQMMCYALAYSQTKGIPDAVNFTLVNVRPKDWRTGPSYEAKVWRVTNEDWEKLSAMCKIYDFEKPKDIRIFKEFRLGQEPEYETIEVEQWINQQTNEIDFAN